MVLVLLTASACRMWRNRERPPFRKVSPSVAFEILRDTPDTPILDLRPSQAYVGDAGHIRNARSFPLGRLPFRLGEISAYRDETFLVYCDTAACGEEGMAVLISSGFENAILIDGGIDGWIDSGFRTQLPEDVAGRSGRQPPPTSAAPATPPAAKE
jgi:rhodanese-related sulfurtransferase